MFEWKKLLGVTKVFDRIIFNAARLKRTKVQAY
jgi:hypothetical protein